MNLEVRHLKLVDMIAREGGLTAASRKLYVTQSALSHQLREIEDRLGAPLFLRSKRKMVLTEAGRCVLKSAESILKELDRTEEEIRRIATGSEGILRISTQCNTCYHWLPMLIQKFQKRYPRVNVHINVEATRDPLEALWKGDLDLAIIYNLPHKKGLNVYPLFDDELVAVMHPKHPLALSKFLKPQDFANENLIMYMTPKEESILFQKVLLPAAVSPSKVTAVMLTEAIIEMVKTGLGISVLSRWFTESYVRDGKVRAVRITRKGLIRNWVAATITRPGIPSFIPEFTNLLSKSALPAVQQKV